MARFRDFVWSGVGFAILFGVRVNGEFGAGFGFMILFGVNGEWRIRNDSGMCGFRMEVSCIN